MKKKKQTKEKLEQIVNFTPAYDKRSSDPKKDYGIGHVKCIMVLRGKKGAVHFSFSTGMLLESTVVDYIKDGRAKYELHEWGHHYLNKPMGYDVGYHTPKPQHEGQEIHHPTKMVKPKNLDMKDVKSLSQIKFKKVGKNPPKCLWIGKPCYCDGSALQAETFMEVLIKEGSDAIWKLLEKEYKLLK